MDPTVAFVIGYAVGAVVGSIVAAFVIDVLILRDRRRNR